MFLAVTNREEHCQACGPHIGESLATCGRATRSTPSPTRRRAPHYGCRRPTLMEQCPALFPVLRVDQLPGNHDAQAMRTQLYLEAMPNGLLHNIFYNFHLWISDYPSLGQERDDFLNAHRKRTVGGIQYQIRVLRGLIR